MTGINLTSTPKKIEPFSHRDDLSLTELILDEGIIEIGERAFFGCKNIKKLHLPTTLTFIGASAFCGCENIEEIVIPSNVKKIDYRAFADCKRLKKITIEEGVNELGFNCFSSCENLIEIELPDSIKYLDAGLFMNCKKLEKVKLPKGLSHLPDDIFKNCYKLDILIDKNITKISAGAFENCKNLSTFPSHVTYIGEDSFKGCKKLTTVKLHKNITEIPDVAFENCINLNEITSESDKKITIGKSAFKNCIKLKEVPDFIANYEERSFEGCIGLTKVNINSTSIGERCFQNCINLKEVSNSEIIKDLKQGAFSGCKNLEEINLPKIIKIGAETFFGCTSLRKISMDNVIVIKNRAFYNCVNLQEINFSNYLKTVGTEAFYNCNSITTLYFPENFSGFGKKAFSYMNNLKYIEVSPLNETYISEDHKILFNKKNQSIELYAPAIEDETYSLLDYAITTHEGVEAVRPITFIAEYAFANAKNLKELEIVTSLENIDVTSFIDSPNLKILKVMPIDFYTSVMFKAIEKTKLISEIPGSFPFEEVIYEDGKEDSSIMIFYPHCLDYFRNVKKITFPTSGKYWMREKAFTECKQIKELYIPNNLVYTVNNVFPEHCELTFENEKKLIILLHDNLSNQVQQFNKHSLNNSVGVL